MQVRPRVATSDLAAGPAGFDRQALAKAVAGFGSCDAVGHRIGDTAGEAQRIQAIHPGRHGVNASPEPMQVDCQSQLRFGILPLGPGQNLPHVSDTR